MRPQQKPSTSVSGGRAGSHQPGQHGDDALTENLAWQAPTLRILEEGDPLRERAAAVFAQQKRDGSADESTPDSKGAA